MGRGQVVSHQKPVCYLLCLWPLEISFPVSTKAGFQSPGLALQSPSLCSAPGCRLSQLRLGVDFASSPPARLPFLLSPGQYFPGAPFSNLQSEGTRRQFKGGTGSAALVLFLIQYCVPARQLPLLHENSVIGSCPAGANGGFPQRWQLGCSRV